MKSFSNGKNNYRRICHKCRMASVKQKEYRRKHKDVIYATYKKWIEKNGKKENNNYNSLYYSNNKEKFSEYNKKYRQNNKEALKIKHLAYAKYKYNCDKNFAINSRIKSAMARSLKGNKNGSHWEDLVGYTLNDLMIRIESLFLPNMSWENRNEWHIDHIRPIASFNFTTYEDEEFKQCWALNNLRPLWADENLKKNNKWNKKQQYKNGDIQLALII